MTRNRPMIISSQASSSSWLCGRNKWTVFQSCESLIKMKPDLLICMEHYPNESSVHYVCTCMNIRFLFFKGIFFDAQVLHRGWSQGTNKTCLKVFPSLMMITSVWELKKWHSEMEMMILTSHLGLSVAFRAGFLPLVRPKESLANTAVSLGWSFMLAPLMDFIFLPTKKPPKHETPKLTMTNFANAESPWQKAPAKSIMTTSACYFQVSKPAIFTRKSHVRMVHGARHTQKLKACYCYWAQIFTGGPFRGWGQLRQVLDCVRPSVSSIGGSGVGVGCPFVHLDHSTEIQKW